MEGLGAMYVLEGSSLGRQVMLSKLAQRLNIRPDLGRTFFQRLWQKDGRDVAELRRRVERGWRNARACALYYRVVCPSDLRRL